MKEVLLALPKNRISLANRDDITDHGNLLIGFSSLRPEITPYEWTRIPLPAQKYKEIEILLV